MRDVVFLILLIAGGQGIFLSLILGLGRGKRSSLLLGLMFLSFSLQLFDLVLLYSGEALVYPHLAFWSTPFNLALGPLLYLYVRSSKSNPDTLGKVNWLHFIPFLLHTVYISYIFHFQNAGYKTAFIQEILAIQVSADGANLNLTNILFAIAVYGQLAIYIGLSKVQIRNRQDFKGEMSIWLNKLWMAIVVIAAFGLLQFVLLALKIDQQPITGYIAALLAVIYIYYGAMIVMRKPEVIFNPPKPQKYQYSTLSSAQSQRLLSQLRNFMTEQTPFKNPSLTLKDLALASRISDRHISQVINEQLNQNFHDFLNEYRVNEFKTQLTDPDNGHLSMLGIAMECGFNSKSTFNTTFKRFTGLTPSEFKKKQSSYF